VSGILGSYPYLPDTALYGQTSFEWIEGSAFLMIRSEIDHPKIPDGVATLEVIMRIRSIVCFILMRGVFRGNTR
jgi:hypothetical protein